jgi:hypothetical protein
MHPVAEEPEEPEELQVGNFPWHWQCFIGFTQLVVDRYVLEYQSVLSSLTGPRL